MNKTESVVKFWRDFCTENLNVNPNESYQVWFFGDSQKMARELAELVISGKKHATASLVEFNERHPEAAPISDGFSVVKDFEGVPLCVIQTTGIRHLPFDEVDAQLAFDEGEGDQTLKDWREGHRRYFTKEATDYNLEFNEKSIIACERFKLLHPKLNNEL